MPKKKQQQQEREQHSSSKPKRLRRTTTNGSSSRTATTLCTATTTSFYAFDERPTDGCLAVFVHRSPCTPLQHGPIVVVECNSTTTTAMRRNDNDNSSSSKKEKKQVILCRNCSLSTPNATATAATATIAFSTAIAASSKEKHNNDKQQEQERQPEHPKEALQDKPPSTAKGGPAASVSTTPTTTGAASSSTSASAVSSTNTNSTTTTASTTTIVEQPPPQLDSLDMVVKIPGGRGGALTVSFQLSASSTTTAMTVGALKKKVADKTAVPPARQRLLYLGKLLTQHDDDTSLLTLGLTPHRVNYVHLSPIPRRRNDQQQQHQSRRMIMMSSKPAAAAITPPTSTSGGHLPGGPNGFESQEGELLSSSSSMVLQQQQQQQQHRVLYDRDSLTTRIVHALENDSLALLEEDDGRLLLMPASVHRIEALLSTSQWKKQAVPMASTAVTCQATRYATTTTTPILGCCASGHHQQCCLPHRFLTAMERSRRNVQVLNHGDTTTGKVSENAVKGMVAQLEELAVDAIDFAARLRTVLSYKDSSQELRNDMMRTAMELRSDPPLPPQQQQQPTTTTTTYTMLSPAPASSNAPVNWVAAAVAPTFSPPHPTPGFPNGFHGAIPTSSSAMLQNSVFGGSAAVPSLPNNNGNVPTGGGVPPPLRPA